MKATGSSRKGRAPHAPTMVGRSMNRTWHFEGRVRTVANYPDPGRRSIRLRDFDYAGNAMYFVTVCAVGRRCLFGEIDDGSMTLNAVGAMVEREWLRSATIRVELDLHSFVVMPNHLHCLLTCTPLDEPIPAVGARGARPGPATGLSHRCHRVGRVKGARHAPLRTTPRSLGSFIGGFKAAATRQYREVTGEMGGSLWQRGYYEHVVRDDRDFARIGGYIANNPANWTLDHEHDAGLKSSNDASS